MFRFTRYSMILAAAVGIVGGCGGDPAETRVPLDIPRGLGKADGFSCTGFCGAQAPGGCYCDDACVKYGDCCPDKAKECDQTLPKVCGGIAGLPCPQGMKCKLQGSYPDASGTCVPNAYCDAPSDCEGQIAPACMGAWECVSHSCHFKCGIWPITCAVNSDCKSSEYCASKPGECLLPTFNILQGSCTARPQACTEEYAPVCGCDGKTYGNSCEAAAAGVSVAKQGECAAQPKTCGPILNGQCAAGEGCNIQGCGLGALGTCAPLPKCNPYHKQPVCGCDGKTYNNDCLRLVAGVPLDHDGACQSGGCSSDADCPELVAPGGGGFVHKVCVSGKCVLPTISHCKGFCGGKSVHGCYCDALCSKFGDCCPDVQQTCPNL